MGRNRFVVAGTERLELSDQDWIEVKRQLTYGERLYLNQSIVGELVMSDATDQDDARQYVKRRMDQYNLRRIATWVTDWSFEDSHGKRIAVSMDAIKALDEATGLEIHAALDAHISELEAAGMGKVPNGLAGGPTSS